MRLTLIIPTYTINDDLEDMALLCALKFRKQVDELIICEDGGRYSKNLMSVADYYLYSKTNQGYTKNINNGWRISSGDFTILGNSDTQLMSGNLKDLCQEGYVTCPTFSGYNVENLCGAFFCVPRKIQEQYGYLNERHKMLGADSDYEKKILPIYKVIPTVDVLHFGGKTREAIP